MCGVMERRARVAVHGRVGVGSDEEGMHSTGEAVRRVQRTMGAVKG